MTISEADAIRAEYQKLLDENYQISANFYLVSIEKSRLAAEVVRLTRLNDAMRQNIEEQQAAIRAICADNARRDEVRK